ncbi:hypothetical protein C8R43DRAFT_1118314 [Mycena crocata]|nr:hypothetical protein C8R43DRAFT_1118314 [Mycena crocata]
MAVGGVWGWAATGYHGIRVYLSPAARGPMSLVSSPSKAATLTFLFWISSAVTSDDLRMHFFSSASGASERALLNVGSVRTDRPATRSYSARIWYKVGARPANDWAAFKAWRAIIAGGAGAPCYSESFRERMDLGVGVQPSTSSTSASASSHTNYPQLLPHPHPLLCRMQTAARTSC